MDTGFVKRIGDVIIERVGPPGSSAMTPPPPESDVSRPPGDEQSEPPPVTSDDPMTLFPDGPSEEGRMASSDPPGGVHDRIDDSLPDDDPPEHAEERVRNKIDAQELGYICENGNIYLADISRYIWIYLDL